MKQEITQRDLENSQRFIAEGLGAPEFTVVRTGNQKNRQESGEVQAQTRADCIHCICA